MSEIWPRRVPPDQSSGSAHTLATSRHPYITDPIPSKRVCFYKSGDPQFNGLRMVINNRTFKTFDGLLDSLSKKVPLPFGVRNITTPRGVHAVRTLGELEDGKSYICSDSRKVKPINLALARRKLPPWYNARPVSARRQAVQLARQQPGRATRKQEPVVVRTPKRLTVFRNGDPSIRHTVIMQKRTTPTFQILLDYLSELMEFHVTKLHTPDGRRVDGLPALILCSGTVVAAGREPFKFANYNAQKSPAPTWLPTNRMGPRRLKQPNRKKKSLSSVSKSRNFSLSSERYFLNQIQNSIAGSLCDLPSNQTGSVELEAGQALESVAETEGDTCLGDGAEGQHECMPTDDDIEKSFRVNQDGSMTVEMRVRLTIKEEEAIHWTTTLTRSAVANTINTASLPDPESIPGEENGSPDFDPPESQDSADSTDTADKKNTKDNDDDPPSMDNGILSEDRNGEDNIKSQGDIISPKRLPTPGPRSFRQKQASMESIRTMTDEEIQEDVVGSYCYREQTANGAVIEESCTVMQSSIRPVPKPRRVGSVEVHNRNNRNRMKTNGVAETLQSEDSGEETTETVFHIYEQQTCQDNFLANSQYCTQGISMYGRPATSDTARFSSSNDFETELGRPSTASETISIWRADTMSLKSNLTIPFKGSGVDSLPASISKVKKPPFSKIKDKHSFELPSESSKENPHPRTVNKSKKVASKPKVIKKHVRQNISAGKRRKDGNASSQENSKKRTTFSSAGFLKKIYGHKPKSVKKMAAQKQKVEHTGDEGIFTEGSERSGGTMKRVIEEPNALSPVRETKNKVVSFESNKLDSSPTRVSPPRGILRRQKSIRQERNKEREFYDVNENLPLPAVNSSSSVINEYVEHWLERNHPNSTAYEPQKADVGNQVGTTKEISERPERNYEEIIATKESNPSEANTQIPNCPSFENIPLPDCLQEHEEMPCPLMEKMLSTTQTAGEMRQDSLTKNKLVPIEASVSTPIGSPVEKAAVTNTEHSVLGTSSVASSPLYPLLSSVASEDRPVSMSATSDQAPSPADHTPENAKAPLRNKEEYLSRNPSVKRARLVSNLSFERKMSLKKASLEKSTLTSKVSQENTVSSIPITIAVENKAIPEGLSGQDKTELAPENLPQPNPVQDLSSQASSPSFCISASPTSSTSEERASSDSLSSDEAPTPFTTLLKESEESIVTPCGPSNQKLTSSPKSPKKKPKLVSNLSLENKMLIRTSSEKSESTIDPALEKNQTTSSPSMGRSPLPRNGSLKSSRNPSPDKNASPNTGRKKTAASNSSPTTERLQSSHKVDLKNRLSPYSQSLEVVSPPMKRKSKKKSMSKNLSFDNTPKPADQALQKTSSDQKEGSQTTPLSKSTTKISDASPDKSLPCASLIPMNADVKNDIKGTKTDHKYNTTAAQERSLIETQTTPQPLQLTKQLDIKPVLEKLCYSIKSIRQITQNKRSSCLEKSNSLPDFSSHVASTFGSSYKALLAFLSVMTLKEGATNLNIQELNANNVSCAEALKMIDSLREIANIEESNKLKASLSDLQQSTSAQLWQSWKGFQELHDKCKSRSPTPYNSEEEQESRAFSAEDIEENAIGELINEFDMPEKLKEELAALPVSKIIEINNEGKKAPRITENVLASPEEKVNVNLLKAEVAGVNELTLNDETNSVKSMIKKFMTINQCQESDQKGLSLTVEKASCKPQKLSDYQKDIHVDQLTRKRDSEHETGGLGEKNKAKSLNNPTDNKVKQMSKDNTIKNPISRLNDDKDTREGTELSMAVENGQIEDEEEYHTIDKPSKEDVRYMNLNANTETNRSGTEADMCSSDEALPDIKCKVRDRKSPSTAEDEDNLEDEVISEDEIYSDEEEKGNARVDENVEQKSSSQELVETSELYEESGSGEEQDEGDYKDLQRTHPDEVQPSPNKCTGFNSSSESSMSSPDVSEQTRSEDEKPKDKSTELQQMIKVERECPVDKQRSPMGLNISSEETVSSPDVEVLSSSEEEQLDVENGGLQAVKQESLSNPEEAQDDLEEEQENHVDDQQGHEDILKKLNELTECSGSNGNSAQESRSCLEDDADNLIYAEAQTRADLTYQKKDQLSVNVRQSGFIDDQDRCVSQENGRLLRKSSTSEEHYSFDVDEDSGNDHGSCEEHVDEVQQREVGDEQCSSTENQFCFEEKHSFSDKQAGVEVEESYAVYQETHANGEPTEAYAKSEIIVEQPRCRSVEQINQSVAERISKLEKQVDGASQKKKVVDKSDIKPSAKEDVPSVSHVKDSTPETDTSHSPPTNSSVHHSSLSFSYDSSGVITKEPERNRVRSIKEMFMARSAADIQYGQRQFPSPNTSELSDYRPETSDSGGYQSQTSPELSSGEDDSSRKSIAKGFVRRTIERLYGKKDTKMKEPEIKTHPSPTEDKNTETSSIFSPFHLARTKLVSDLSYFNSANTTETYTEPTRCITFNAQVRPDDSVTMNEEKWFAGENAFIKKSISDPTGINKPSDKSLRHSDMWEDTKEDAPYSLFSTKSEDRESKVRSAKCTYFSLRHASESDLCQEDLSTASVISAKGDGTAEKTEESERKTWSERNGTLPSIIPSEFKMPDNKVHPIVEDPIDGAVVVVQPGKGHGVVSRPQQPDALDMLYNFCGQHCPIL